MDETWERLEHETSKQYEGFQAYLELGVDRNIPKAANAVVGGKASGERVARFRQWCADNAWVRRAVEYDAWMLDQRRMIIQDEVLSMAARHAREAIVVQQKVLEKLANFDSRSLSNADLIRWLAEAVKIERLARGEPTERLSTEQTGIMTIQQQVAQMTDEELESEIGRYTHTLRPQDRCRSDVCVHMPIKALRAEGEDSQEEARDERQRAGGSRHHPTRENRL